MWVLFHFHSQNFKNVKATPRGDRYNNQGEKRIKRLRHDEKETSLDYNASRLTLDSEGARGLVPAQPWAGCASNTLHYSSHTDTRKRGTMRLLLVLSFCIFDWVLRGQSVSELSCEWKGFMGQKFRRVYAKSKRWRELRHETMASSIHSVNKKCCLLPGDFTNGTEHSKWTKMKRKKKYKNFKNV